MVYSTSQLLGALLTVDGRAVEGGAIELPTNARLLLDVIVEGSAPGAVLDNLALLTPEVLADIEAAGALGATNDTATASFVNNAASATAVALAGKYAGVAERPINVSEKYGRDDTAVRAAVTAAVSSGRPLFFSDGTFTVTGDLTISSAVELMGDGYGSQLTFTDGGLIYNGTAGFLLRPNWRDLRIRRIGTVAGPALHLKGAGNSTGVARFNGYNLHLQSALGDALLVEGSYIGNFYGCFFEDSVTGVRGKIETTTGIVGVNALNFFGGESYGNNRAWEFDRPSGVNMYGFCTEGNEAGGKLVGVARGFRYSGGYFESNQGPDIEVDCNAGSGGIVIDGATFFTIGMTKTESILLRRGRVAIRDNHFNGLSEAGGDVAIRISEGTSPVSGYESNNMRDDDGTIVGYTTGGAAFNITQLGQVTKRGSTISSSTLNEQAGVRKWRGPIDQVVDPGSIPANSEVTFTITVPGAAVGDNCEVTSSLLEADLAVTYKGVTGTDTITVRLRNHSAAAIDPASRTWRAHVWR